VPVPAVPVNFVEQNLMIGLEEVGGGGETTTAREREEVVERVVLW
jgi:hypothetical protein